jgi:hypothetical protein
MEELMEVRSDNKKCCIVVPIVSVSFNNSELTAIRSLNKLTADYPIVFIGTLSSYTSNIVKIKELLADRPFTFKEFDSRYFESLTSYSNLLMSPIFYKSFDEYEYLLVFQTDALIVRGDLEQFINLNKVYIGAPWIVKNKHTKNLLIGNGGLSLRKVKEFTEITELHSLFPSHWWFNFPKMRYLRWCAVGFLFPPLYLFNLGMKLIGRSLFFDIHRLLSTAEDVSFAKWLVQNDIELPTIKEAVDFSFESDPHRCYEINDYQLPFGCHAWERYDLDFWKAHLTDSSNKS